MELCLLKEILIQKKKILKHELTSFVKLTTNQASTTGMAIVVQFLVDRKSIYNLHSKHMTTYIFFYLTIINKVSKHTTFHDIHV